MTSEQPPDLTVERIHEILKFQGVNRRDRRRRVKLHVRKVRKARKNAQRP